MIYLKNRGSVDIDSVVVHHLHNGHTEVTANAKGDAEAQPAEDGDDVALRQTATAAIHQRCWPRCRGHRAPILCQFNSWLFFNISTIYFSESK